MQVSGADKFLSGHLSRAKICATLVGYSLIRHQVSLIHHFSGSTIEVGTGEPFRGLISCDRTREGHLSVLARQLTSSALRED